MLKAKPLTIAVIGAGLWGPNLIRSFHTHPESTVTWVSDLDTVRLKALKENYRGISVTPDWVTAVTQPEVDCRRHCDPDR